MPNVTISVSEELKVEMDKFPEVSWSEICRKAITRYIDQRKNPTPNIELDLRHATLIDHDLETGYPTLRLTLRIHNKMDSEITVDRILCNAMFFPHGESHGYSVGSAYNLYKRNIAANSSGSALILLTFPKEKIDDLKNVFNATFDCRVRCVVYVDGFRNEYEQTVQTIIPIDQWNDVVRKALKKHQPTRG